MSSSSDEDAAIVSACAYAGQVLSATGCALARGDHLRRWIGQFDGRSAMVAAMAMAQPGRRQLVDVAGFGPTAVMAARLHDGDRLVVVRPGRLPFTAKELNLLRGMAQVLSLSGKMLRTLEAEQRRRHLVRHLYSIQRAISRRIPLQLIFEHIVRSTQQILGTPTDVTALWLLDLDNPSQAQVVAALGFDLDRWIRGIRFPVAATGAPGRAIRTGQKIVVSMAEADVPQLPSQTGRPALHTIAVPVYRDGRIHGSLMVSRGTDRPFTMADQENVQLLAEHVSMAITDAKLVADIAQARHDALTGLASRALFLARLGGQLVSAPSSDIAALFIDLDRFKAVNDTLGHNAGDELLTIVAQRITGIVRREDHAARFGGDEFAVMLPGVPTEQQVRDIALRIVEELSRPVAVTGGTAQVSASVGIARSHGTPIDPKELVRRADVAMYEAKRAGRHGVAVYSPEMERVTGGDARWDGAAQDDTNWDGAAQDDTAWDGAGRPAVGGGHRRVRPAGCGAKHC